MLSSGNKVYTIIEYDGFVRDRAVPGYHQLPVRAFDALESFILANSPGSATEAVELLSLSVRRNVGKIITARNYVGVIAMTNGTVIEILPKIAGKGIGKAETKQIFLEMLRELHEAPFKDFKVSHLHIEHLSLLEIFMRMFLTEVGVIAKQGLKSAYIPVEDNERFYKGKLVAAKHIQSNLVRKDRFFIQYDDFNTNRSENRLIKSTLRFLLNMTDSMQNRQHATRLLAAKHHFNIS